MTDLNKPKLNAKATFDEAVNIKGDDKKKFDLYLQAAEEGLAEAQCMVGRCYYEGEGVEQDDDKAFEWFFKAAEQGESMAKFFSGICYAEACGVKKDYQKAKFMFSSIEDSYDLKVNGFTILRRAVFSDLDEMSDLLRNAPARDLPVDYGPYQYLQGVLDTVQNELDKIISEASKPSVPASAQPRNP